MESYEDEAFNEIERQAKQRKEAVRATMLRVEDDDIQDYKKPWIGLTDEEVETTLKAYEQDYQLIAFAQAIEAKLKEKNA